MRCIIPDVECRHKGATSVTIVVRNPVDQVPIEKIISFLESEFDKAEIWMDLLAECALSVGDVSLDSEKLLARTNFSDTGISLDVWNRVTAICLETLALALVE